ncbi:MULTISPECIES: hypothetical protein [unclassified Mesorhizobium]|nr:hypothetical protein [Mesorhizobium sp. L2C085B000]ESZ17778.1 hypothetical protein X735_11890 [Mesorhizobium sp. L2C085B000]
MPKKLSRQSGRASHVLQVDQTDGINAKPAVAAGSLAIRAGE